MADAATVEKATGAAVGFAGPIGLQVRTVADYAVAAVQHAICGANETGAHLVDVDPTRDLSKLIYADLRNAVPGDACARCEDGVYGGHRGIEVGHVFYLGTRYSKAMGAAYLDADGKEQPLEMGCYGIGITRTAAAAIEQNHDQHGMIWPLPIAPAHVHLAIVHSKEAKQRELGESLYRDLQQAGVEVLLDDREERPGVKFKDADLIGIPLRVTAGGKGLERGVVELKPRRGAETFEVSVGDAAGKIIDWVRDSGTS
jgi:prolyl-tRNA synthetase